MARSFIKYAATAVIAFGVGWGACLQAFGL
jgi:hypothetical protein